MFFRIVTTKYKNNEYNYLKLLESYRSGEKVKQKVLMNIANLDRMPAYKAKVLADKLHESLDFCKLMRASSTTGARFSKISYIFSIERAFKPLKGCSDSDIRDMYLNEKIKARYSISDREQFYNFIHDKVFENGKTPGILIFAQKLKSIFDEADDQFYLAILLNSSGMPLKYTVFRQQPGRNKIAELIQEVKDIYETSLVTALVCEETYRNSMTDFSTEEFKENIFSEVFLHRKVADWLGNSNFTTDRYILINRMRHNNEQITGIINRINDFIDYLNWIIDRAQTVLKGNYITATEVLDITFISHIFYKQIVSILEKNNLILAGGKTKFFHEMPVQNNMHPGDKLL